jgi:hypothetical protein
MMAAGEILPENLPAAWSDGQATALSVATNLSLKVGQTLPWKTVSDVITGAINARFVELDGTSGDWPCEYPGAQSVKLKMGTYGPAGPPGGGAGPAGGQRKPGCLYASAELGPAEIQDLGDSIPALLDLKTQLGTPFKFQVQFELGDGEQKPSVEAASEFGKLLREVKDAFELQ